MLLQSDMTAATAPCNYSVYYGITSTSTCHSQSRQRSFIVLPCAIDALGYSFFESHPTTL